MTQKLLVTLSSLFAAGFFGSGFFGSVTAPAAYAQTSPTSIEFDRMTWPELKKAIHEQGKTTVLVFNGGTEQRGPQNVAGGHTLIARETAIRIANKLGNAIVAPVLPFSVNNANAELPGTIGLTAPLFRDINEQVAEQLIKNGFRNVVLMGDHGGGQKELAELASTLTARHAADGARVIYCDAVYEKANNDFNQYLADNGYPPSTHAGIPDTSEMLYLGGDQGWVRKDLVPSALGDMPAKPGEARDPNRKRVGNGISGDARRSTAELGKRFIDLKVNYAVAQIQQLLGTGAPAAATGAKQ